MNILKRIWNWIKETAWIQPLLIVGIIFGVIFSIKPITDAVTAAIENSASSDAFYSEYGLSLEKGEDSEADVFTRSIEEQMNDSTSGHKYGDKFFLAYVSNDCAGCEEAQGGFETLKNNFKGSLSPKDGLDFEMYTINTSEQTDDTTSSKSAFVQYMDRNPYFFEEAGGVGQESAYYLNGHLSDADLDVLRDADPDNFLTPTILLIDFTSTSPSYGISEVMFGVTGDNDMQKAQLLLDCWNHDGEFTDK